MTSTTNIPWQDRVLVQRRHRKIVSERRIPPHGEVLIPLREDEVRHAARALKAAGVEAIAVGFLEMSRRYWQAWLHQTPGPSDPGTPRHQIQHMIDLPHQELCLKRALEPPWRRAPCHETKNPYGKYLFPIDQASQRHGLQPLYDGDAAESFRHTRGTNT